MKIAIDMVKEKLITEKGADRNAASCLLLEGLPKYPPEVEAGSGEVEVVPSQLHYL